MKRELFIVSGMQCAACAAAVERVVRKLPGLSECSLNLASGKMRVAYDEGQLNSEQIKAKVKKAGFKAENYKEKTRQEQAQEKLAQRKAYCAERNRLLVALMLSAILMYLAMAHMWPQLPCPDYLSYASNCQNYIVAQALLAAIIIFIGRRFYISGYGALWRGYPNMDSLVALGSSSAYLFSAYVAIKGNFSSDTLHNLYFESSAIVVTLVALGKHWERGSSARTAEAVLKLKDLTPDMAILLPGHSPDPAPEAEGQATSGKVTWPPQDPTTQEPKGLDEEAKSAVLIDSQLLCPEDIILIKPGAKVPADGLVCRGSGHFQEAMLTGESRPVSKKFGDKVYAGTLSLDGALEVKVSQVGSETVISGIIAFVERAQESKPPLAKTADKIAGLFVPGVMACAVVTALVWWLLGAETSSALQAAISVLVISCPCAVGIAAPAAIAVGTGKAATLGILIRNGAALESACQTTAVVFDKTGTLTETNLQAEFIAGSSHLDRQWLEQTIALAESSSSHPLAEAFQNLTPHIPDQAETRLVQEFTNYSGLGVKAKLSDGHCLWAGSRRFMAEQQLLKAPARLAISNKSSEAAPSGPAVGQAKPSTSESNDLAEPELKTMLEAEKQALAQGKTPVFVAIDGTLQGLFAVSAPLKAESFEIVSAFKTMGLKTVLISGDTKECAQYVGQQLGFEELLAEVMPQDKAEAIKALQEQGLKVMMIGDGINDAPALVQADTGFAIGRGSDAALEAADIILTSNNLWGAVKALKLSQQTLLTIKENLFWAMVYNTLAIPIAAGVFYPLCGLQLSPMLAATAMCLSSLGVVYNSLRLGQKKLS